MSAAGVAAHETEHFVEKHKTEIGVALLITGGTIATGGALLELGAVVEALSSEGGLAALAEEGSAPIFTKGSAMVVGGAGASYGGFRLITDANPKQPRKAPLTPLEARDQQP